MNTMKTVTLACVWEEGEKTNRSSPEQVIRWRDGEQGARGKSRRTVGTSSKAVSHHP